MKKIICLGLIVAGLLTSISGVSAMTDLQKSELVGFGIMVGDGNGNLRLNDNITRAEAVKIICTAGKLTRAEGNIAPFPDVPNAFWGYEYIMTAKSHGVVVGDENGNFNPQSSVTNEEFIKMAVCLLNYQEVAKAQGGYPAGYMRVASVQGITKDMQFDVGVPATRHDVGVMIHNALDINLLLSRPNKEHPTDTEYYKSDYTLRDNFR